MKQCKDCEAEGITTSRPTPHPGPRCTTHHRARRKAVATRNHERRVMSTYGLSEGDYERLYQAQGGRCFICQRAKGKTKRLAVDHDHETSEVRGLLCSADNVHIGYLRHDPEAARRMMLYLRDPPARYILDHGKDDT